MWLDPSDPALALLRLCSQSCFVILPIPQIAPFLFLMHGQPRVDSRPSPLLPHKVSLYLCFSSSHKYKHVRMGSGLVLGSLLFQCLASLIPGRGGSQARAWEEGSGKRKHSLSQLPSQQAPWKEGKPCLCAWKPQHFFRLVSLGEKRRSLFTEGLSRDLGKHCPRPDTLQEARRNLCSCSTDSGSLGLAPTPTKFLLSSKQRQNIPSFPLGYHMQARIVHGYTLFTAVLWAGGTQTLKQIFHD